MRIGIDARTILNPEKGEAIGVGHYTYQLIKNLLDIDRENHYVIFFDFRVREKDVKKFTRPNTTIKFYPFSDYKKYLPGAYNEILGTATLTKEKLDVIHSTSPLSRIPVAYRGKVVVTFHDLAIYKCPQNFSAVKTAHRKAIFNLMVKKADKIIAVSQSIKNDLQEIFGVPEEKISVIYSGLDKRFFEKPSVDVNKVLSRFNIRKKYVFYLGTIEPIKNISRLLEAFASFKENYRKKFGRFDYQLVMAGKRGWLAKEFAVIAKDLDLAKDIVFTGYVIGEELVPLFKGSEFFIMPSLYEGFGMTVLEAFATGAPAIISRVSSLPEIAGEAAYFVNPLDKEEIAQAIMKFATDENLRNSYREKGIIQARKFDWEKTAKETLEVYKSFSK